MCAPDDKQQTKESFSTQRHEEGYPTGHPADKPTQQCPPRSTVLSQQATSCLAGVALAAGVTFFSGVFPFVLAPHAARKTYQAAFYNYNETVSRFDNTFATYSTDYLLALVMMTLAASISLRLGATTRALAFRSRGLLYCYMVSVTAGGLAHQFYTTNEMRNSLSFRILWTVCVGTVCMASGFMGAVGAELVRKDHAKGFYFVPLLPESFWVAFGTCITLFCVAGGLSYQRPACDIFVAGITQAPSTFYLMLILAMGLPAQPIPPWARAVGFGGFIFNVPLLPMYPLLIQYSEMSLGAVNTFLHTWLMVTWSMQGLSLRRVARAIAATEGPPHSAFPIKRKIQ